MRIVYQYNFRGNLIKNIGYDNNNTEIFFTELVYNSDGLLAKEIIKDTQYLNDIVSGEYDFITTYEYDADNKIIKSFHLLKNGEIIGYSLFTFENDKIIIIENGDADNNILGTIFFEYDNNGKRINTQNDKNEIISWREYGENDLLEKVNFRDGTSRVFMWENKTTRYNQDMYTSY
jgi:hypothetical protein